MGGRPGPGGTRVRGQSRVALGCGLCALGVHPRIHPTVHYFSGVRLGGGGGSCRYPALSRLDPPPVEEADVNYLERMEKAVTGLGRWPEGNEQDVIIRNDLDKLPDFKEKLSPEVSRRKIAFPSPLRN